MSLHQHLSCCAYVATDLIAGFCGMLGLSLVRSGQRHARYNASQSVEYIESYVNHFEDLLGGSGAFRGDVCELGPGDSLGGGVLYQLRGAESVTFFERFQRQPSEQERAICQLLYENETRKSSLASNDSPPFPAVDPAKAFRVIHGVTAESYLEHDPARYDLIVSNSVLQHTTDPLPLLQLCYDRLKPGGRMAHVIDLRSLGILSQWGELAWLSTSPQLHRRMVRHTGRPNRVRYKEYIDWAKASGCNYSVRIRHLAGSTKHWADVAPKEIPEDAWRASEEFVRRARPGFTPSLRAHSDREHAVATFILVLEKPA
ncbi:class I SAM-dependent methyltransferase [Cerasicoccus maritimus]|uniref:class I SAM-dependent methyltransferase n=1 Tax=Cerasicoccus maritimus TaxID=490089 RepID=UPI0028525BC0|nr:class I SAM-dependent methyltransferase [Cerasicoccus maritimus]